MQIILYGCYTVLTVLFCDCLKIKVPHPSYPSTRVSFQVPNLDIHFSPKRYGKIVELLGVLCKLKGSDSEDSDSCENCNLAPWYPADLAGDARTLVWKVLPCLSFLECSSHMMHLCSTVTEFCIFYFGCKGLGYSLAEWHTSYVVLSGMYLYILESEVSQDYQRCCRYVLQSFHHYLHVE